MSTYGWVNGYEPSADVSAMFAPVQCKRCGCVHDSGPVEVIARYADCSVWKCPGCGVAVDDRPPRWGGGVYKLDRHGRRADAGRSQAGDVVAVFLFAVVALSLFLLGVMGAWQGL